MLFCDGLSLSFIVTPPAECVEECDVVDVAAGWWTELWRVLRRDALRMSAFLSMETFSSSEKPIKSLRVMIPTTLYIVIKEEEVELIAKPIGHNY